MMFKNNNPQQYLKERILACISHSKKTYPTGETELFKYIDYAWLNYSYLTWAICQDFSIQLI